MSEDDGMTVAMNDIPLGAVLFKEWPPQLHKFPSYCIHYGRINDGCPDQPQLSDGEQSEVLQIQANAMVLRRSQVSTVGGSSGSPVFKSKTGELVGVHFSGNEQTRTGYAVHFKIVRDFLRKLIPSISDVRRLNDYIATYLQMTDGPLRNEMLQRIGELKQRLLQELRALPWSVELINVPSWVFVLNIESLPMWFCDADFVLLFPVD